MPTLGASGLGGIPGVESSVLGAVSVCVVVTPAVFGFGVQVFHHPGLFTNLKGLVGIFIGIRHGAVNRGPFVSGAGVFLAFDADGPTLDFA